MTQRGNSERPKHRCCMELANQSCASAGNKSVPRSEGNSRVINIC